MRMTPRAGDGTPRPWPTLVEVEAHEFELRSPGGLVLARPGAARYHDDRLRPQSSIRPSGAA
jgi:hypothetical protein